MIVYTIGYAGLTWDRLQSILETHHISQVVDVRSTPFSKAHPMFNRTSLEIGLPKHGFSYRWMGDVLGARPTSPEVMTDGRVDFEKVISSPSFLSGMDRLEQSGSVLLCSEKDHEECHRSILIGRVLHSRGIEVCNLKHDSSFETQADFEARIVGLYRSPLEICYFSLNKKIGWQS